MRKFKWHVRGYYNAKAHKSHPKKLENDLAIEIGGTTREALDMDISVLKERKDIGLIVLILPNGNEDILSENY